MKKRLLLSALLIFACSSDDSSNEANEPCPSQPELQTNPVTLINFSVTNDSYEATLNGNINNIPLGENCEVISVTSQGFVYDTTVQPTISDNIIEVNGQEVSEVVTGLSSETTYYVRTFITNPLGTFYGNEISFETSETPDLEDPIITILGNNPVRFINFEYFEYGATAVDNVDGDLTSVIEVSSNVNQQVEGTYEVIYSVSDSSGNTASETRIVEIYGNPVYLAENGVTVKAYDWAIALDVGYVNGIEYRVVGSDFYILTNWVNAYEPTYRICTSNVTNLTAIFSSFNNSFTDGFQYWNWSERNLDDWDVSSVYNMSYMFYFDNQNNSIIDGDLSAWDTSNVTDMSYMFYNTGPSSNIGSWDTSNVTDMSYMFYQGYAPSATISNWDVSNVTNMSYMFYEASINQPIGNWDVSNVTNMSWMFTSSVFFNQDISTWNVSSVTNCTGFNYYAPQWTLPQPNFTNCTP